jgi:hypothetical protein
MARLCAHCNQPIPDAKRQGTRFCKASCRVNRHIATKSPATLAANQLRDVQLSPEAAGLLLASSVPWYPYLPSRPRSQQDFYRHPPSSEERIKAVDQWRQAERFRQAAAKRLQRTTQRLAALGLLRIGKPLDRNRIVIECTKLGLRLVKMRHNELPAIANRIGWPVQAEYREFICWA